MAQETVQPSSVDAADVLATPGVGAPLPSALPPAQEIVAPPPPHTKTESTIAPTAEFTRIFLLAWIVRYVFRGFWGEVTNPRTFNFIKTPFTETMDFLVTDRKLGRARKILQENLELVKEIRAGRLKELDVRNKGPVGALYRQLRPIFRGWRDNPSDRIPDLIKNAHIDTAGVIHIAESTEREFRNAIRGAVNAMGYGASIGLGSAALSWRYGRMVRNDILNIFREAVAHEKGINEQDVTFKDIKTSSNVIIQKTVANYNRNMWSRLGTDGLFLAFLPAKSNNINDFLLGVKGVQIFADTWKRKSTMFEDLVFFVHNKINPRNGLGQPISVGDIFDLYQHYSEAFNREAMFRNVVSKNANEGDLWARGQVVFQRITDLMNSSYAYKHKAQTDAAGNRISEDDFGLPKFVYLLGHNLIDARQPELTLARIEIANKHGIGAVKDMQARLTAGQSLEAILQRYPVAQAAIHPQRENADVPDPSKPASTILASSVAAKEMASPQPSAQIAIP